MGPILDFLKRLYKASERRTVFVNDVLSIGEVVALLWRSRVMIATTTILAMVCIYLLSLLVTPLYESKSSLYTASAESRTGSLLGGLGAMASAFGYGLPQGGSLPLAVDELLTSRRLLEPLARSNVPVEGEGVEGPPLYEHWTGPDISESERLQQTVDRLQSAIKVHSSIESSLVHLQIAADSPLLARTLNQRLLDLAESYYRETRTLELQTQKQFLEVSATDMRNELNQTEERLTDFLTRNTSYQQSPLLLQEYARLVRNIELQQKAYVELEAQLLSVGLELSGQTASLRLLNDPSTPLFPSYPDRKKILLLAFIAGLMVNLLLVFILNAFAVDAGSSRARP